MTNNLGVFPWKIEDKQQVQEMLILWRNKKGTGK